RQRRTCLTLPRTQALQEHPSRIVDRLHEFVDASAASGLVEECSDTVGGEVESLDASEAVVPAHGAGAEVGGHDLHADHVRGHDDLPRGGVEFGGGLSPARGAWAGWVPRTRSCRKGRATSRLPGIRTLISLACAGCS